MPKRKSNVSVEKIEQRILFYNKLDILVRIGNKNKVLKYLQP